MEFEMFSFSTPEIPEWIREISHPDYRNVFDYNLGNQNLWGTETLLGDWSGRHLLIAKDFYPSRIIDERRAVRDPHPYRHGEKTTTNLNLLKTLRHFDVDVDAMTNTTCDFLYTSACFLLRNDGQVSGPLPKSFEVLELSAPVLAFTMDHMPRLEVVVLMGDEAECVADFECVRRKIRDRPIRSVSVCHPAARISDARRFAEWRPIFARRKL